jgi:hypothetical protein
MRSVVTRSTKKRLDDRKFGIHRRATAKAGHRFKTVGMEAGIETRVLDAIQGHAPRTASDSYGDVTVKAMAQAMERVPRVEV